MDRQEFFSESIRRIRAQGALGRMTAYAPCRYLTSDGRRCAVGVMIPLGKYTREFEGLQPSSVMAQVFGQEFAAGIGTQFLKELQVCHDHALDVDDFEARVRVMAKNYDLSFPEREGAR